MNVAYLTVNLETEEFFIEWGAPDSIKPVNYIKIAETLGKLNAGGRYIDQIKYAILNFGMENVETEHARSMQMLEWITAFTYKYSEGKFPEVEGELEVEAELDSEGGMKSDDRIFVTPDQSFEGVEDEEEHF